MIPDTLCGCLQQRVEATPGAVAYWRRSDDSSTPWHPITWQVFADHVARLAGRLRALGLEPGERVAILLATGPEWEYCHHAVLAAGGTVIGLDSHDTDENLGHALSLASPAMLIAEDGALLQRLDSLFDAPPRLRIVRSGPSVDDTLALADLLDPDSAFDSSPLPAVTPDMNATIVFTSGSTGRPKGIAYTHGQLSLVGHAILERFPEIREGARLACWLPLSNLFQRVINLCGLICGAQSWFVAQPTQIVSLLPEIQPTVFIGVPRFFEKLHAGIEARLASVPGWQASLVRKAWDLNCRVRGTASDRHQAGVLAKLAASVTDKLLLSRIRSIMGPNLRFMVSGSAAMPTWLLQRFHGLGWLVLEAYGTSESALPIALNTPSGCRFGSVGQALPQNTVRIADDGEVLVRGPTVFASYLGAPADESPIDGEGFLHTGDLGHIDEDGYLWLTGRKSEIFKTSTGRRIAPVPVEAALKRIPRIEHAVLVGRDRPYPIALLDLSPTSPGEPGAIAHEALASAIHVACAGLPGHMRPAAAILSRRAFSIAGGELTANLKLRRRDIESHYAHDIDSAYAELARRGLRADSSEFMIIEAT